MPSISKKPGGRPRRDDVTTQQVQELLEQGFSLRQIARQLQAGYGTVHRALRGSTGLPEVIQNPTAELM